jgi:hypothetical protein
VQPPQLTEKLADPALCPSLPLNARCGETDAGLKMRVTGFSRDGYSVFRLVDTLMQSLAAGCRNRGN